MNAAGGRLTLGSRKLDKRAQRPDELKAFVDLMAIERVRSYLEIGLRVGATFRYVGSELPKLRTMVGIDLPAAVWGVNSADVLQAVAKIHASANALRRPGRQIEIILDDSTAIATVDLARSYGPFDMIFIDGDHSPQGVRADWAHYSPMARMVAFHDIDAANGRLAPERLATYGVPDLWREVKARFRHIEIIGSRRGMGIGVAYVRDE